MFDTVRYLLLQVRNDDDPMAGHEIECFARALKCSPDQIREFDLIAGSPSDAELDAVDIVLLGGSGDYCVSKGGAWMEPAMVTMRRLHETSKPTFASCWGFQAMAKALGGEVGTDLSRAELGTLPVRLTPEGEQDPVFGPLGKSFQGQMGHHDIVVRLPPKAILLATSDRVENQAFTFPNKPIYCTQFHPELNRTALLERLHAYPQYVEQIAGMTQEKFTEQCRDTPEIEALLLRFVSLQFSDRA